MKFKKMKLNILGFIGSIKKMDGLDHEFRAHKSEKVVEGVRFATYSSITTCATALLKLYNYLPCPSVCK